MASPLLILVDLNIVLDVIQRREPFYAQSAQVLDAVARQQLIGFLAAHSVTTLFYLLHRFQSRGVALVALNSLLGSFHVAAVDDTVIRTALSWGWRDFEDAVQMAAAVEISADYLITRNVRDFEAGPIPVIQPGALLALLSSNAKQ